MVPVTAAALTQKCGLRQREGLVAMGSSDAGQHTDTHTGILWLPGAAGRAVRASKGRGGLRLAQNHFGFVETSADACLTLCTAGGDTEEKALHFSGKGSIGEALEPLALDRAVEGGLPPRAWGLWLERFQRSPLLAL